MDEERFSEQRVFCLLEDAVREGNDEMAVLIIECENNVNNLYCLYEILDDVLRQKMYQSFYHMFHGIELDCDKLWNIYSLMLSNDCFHKDGEYIECLFRVLETPALYESPDYKSSALQQLFTLKDDLDYIEIMDIVEYVVKTVPKITNDDVKCFMINSTRYRDTKDILELLLMTEKAQVNVADIVKYAVYYNPVLVPRLLRICFSICPNTVLQYLLFPLPYDLNEMILLSDILHLCTASCTQAQRLLGHLSVDITSTHSASLKEIEDIVDKLMLKFDDRLQDSEKPLMSHCHKEMCSILCERRVPTLMECARDSVRKMMTQCYGPLASKHLQELELPKHLLDIVTCKTPLYQPHLPIPRDIRHDMLQYRQYFYIQ